MKRLEPIVATCVKITVYAGHIPYEVVYYRNRIPAYMAARWMWYFEYLAALVKVNNPHRHVDLYVGPQTLRQGRDYVEHKIETLLRAKRARLKKECRPVDDDLFGYRSEEQRKRIDALYHEIDKLERGESGTPTAADPWDEFRREAALEMVRQGHASSSNGVLFIVKMVNSLVEKLKKEKK